MYQEARTRAGVGDQCRIGHKKATKGRASGGVVLGIKVIDWYQLSWERMIRDYWGIFVRNQGHYHIIPAYLNFIKWNKDMEGLESDSDVNRRGSTCNWRLGVRRAYYRLDYICMGSAKP